MDPKFVVNLSGREYPLFAGVLAEAHERGLAGIETELLQVPTADNEHVAIVRATVRMKDGSVFADLGDASPRNTSSRIATALIRMASTRAKGRALRDAINVGETLLEELPDPDDEIAVAVALAPVKKQAAPSRAPAKYEPGYEPHFTHDGKSYSRDWLQARVLSDQDLAREHGIVLPEIEATRATNEMLWDWARDAGPKLKTVRALKDGKQAAAEAKR